MSAREVVITGAGTGIGRAAAARFVAAGDTVWALGRRRAPLDALRQQLGERVRPIPADVTDLEALRAALAPVQRVDVLLANAGACDAAGLDDADAVAVWRRVLGVNLDGAFHTLHALSARLTEGARVVLVSSGLGKFGRARYTAYTAAKHGVLGIARATALELAPRGVTVNAVCPGWVDTDMARADVTRAAASAGSTPEAARARAEADIPLGRFVNADEVAALVEFLASPPAAAISGQAYTISGGEVRR